MALGNVSVWQLATFSFVKFALLENIVYVPLFWSSAADKVNHSRY